MIRKCVIRMFLVSCLFTDISVADPATAPSELGADSLPKRGVTIERSIPYKQVQDRALLADVYLPASPAARKPYPTLLMIHGGAWFAGNKAHVAYHAEYAATQGYAVMAINYRLAPRHKFPAQLDDCRDALEWIRENSAKYHFDMHRVGTYGYSAGAQLACLLAVSQNEAIGNRQTAAPPLVNQETTKTELLDTQASSSNVASTGLPKIQATVAGGAPCEFSWIPEDSKALAYWLGGSRSARPEIYASASPIEFADRKDPPVFLFHGTSDRVVPPTSSAKMKKKLDRCGVTNEMYLVENGSHIGTFINRSARAKAVKFLDQHLKTVVLPKTDTRIKELTAE